MRGKLKNKKASKTANFGANSMNPFNDKTNQGLKKGYKAHIVEEQVVEVEERGFNYVFIKP